MNFPIGVLLYWLTTNVWSMGQQFYVIRRNPSPGSPAAEALERRKAAKAARHHSPVPSTGTEVEPGTPDPAGPRPGGQRQQPKKPKKKK